MRDPGVFNNPFTFFLVNAFTEAWNKAILETNFKASLSAMYWLTAFLDKEAQEKLKPTIDKMRHFQQHQEGFNSDSYREVLTEVTKELHEQGYFLNARQRPPTVETTLGDIGRSALRANHERAKKLSEKEAP